ncbi:hypothetical protein D3C80_1975750 [compost metagenome]
MSMKGSFRAWLIKSPRIPEQSMNRSASSFRPSLVNRLEMKPCSFRLTSTTSSTTRFTPRSTAQRFKKSATRCASKCHAWDI